MPKVLISDKMSPLAADVFTQRGIEVDVITDMDKDQLAAKIGEYDGIAIRSATKLTPKTLASPGNLKVIGRAGIGVDNVDVKAATSAGIVVMNTPFGNAITTAEHAITMMLSLARQIPAANASTHAGKWEKSRFMGVELMGKTLGIIGCGNIGAIVADRAQGLKMKVIAFDPFLSEERAENLGVEKVTLDELLPRADFISLHTPLTDQTRNILDATALNKTKAGVRVINCARGGLVDELALKAAIESGHIAGAALDVYAEEPAKDNPLFGMEQVVCTPHLGASTSEAQEKVAVQVAEQMADYLLTGAVTNALNMASVTAEEAPKLKPYMSLAEQLGAFAGQATQSAIKGIEICYEGDVSTLNTKPLTAIVLKGLLGPLLEGVNMVNAPIIAEDRNIKILEAKSETAGDYHTLITVTVTTEQQTRSVKGTLFNHQPRIVEIKGIHIDAKLGPNMLYLANHDKPGLIGALGTVLGAAGVNIATFNLGRADEGGDAIALIEIDGQPPADVVSAVQGLEHVMHAIPMRF
ncbi:MAG: phosphoglycerate dehydrogenase [Rhodospirillales bacterium]|nr:phosphoglycerate dehydrogenase [Rhodospirillales bacterium]MBO6786196.1 phosphoglycerate dehydrogenase [Rhodospirillales bacterium]